MLDVNVIKKWIKFHLTYGGHVLTFEIIIMWCIVELH
jgi:hypothetical protein